MLCPTCSEPFLPSEEPAEEGEEVECPPSRILTAWQKHSIPHCGRFRSRSLNSSSAASCGDVFVLTDGSLEIVEEDDDLDDENDEDIILLDDPEDDEEEDEPDAA